MCLIPPSGKGKAKMLSWTKRLLGVACMLLLSADLAAAQTVELMFSGDRPPAFTVDLLRDAQDTAGQRLVSQEGKYTFSVPPDPGQWRREPVVIITVKPHTLANGITTAPLTLELAFSFRPNDTGPVVVHFGLFSAAGIGERQRIDRLLRHQRFDQILSAQGLAQHYNVKLRERALPETQFMTTTWLDALYDAIVREGRPLRPGDAAEDAVEDLMVGDDRQLRLRRAISEMKAIYWRDHALLPGLLSAGDCVSARALVAFLTQWQIDNPDLAPADAPEVLAGMSSRTEAACS